MGSTYFFSGETSQLSGYGFLGGGKWRATYENDTFIPLPGLLGADWTNDKFRTMAGRIEFTGGKLKGLSTGIHLFTGRPTKYSYPFPEADKYRLGALYVGYENYRVGYNSEKNVRGPIQNGFHNIFNYPHFPVESIADKLYFGVYSGNPYSLW